MSEIKFEGQGQSLQSCEEKRCWSGRCELEWWFSSINRNSEIMNRHGWRDVFQMCLRLSIKEACPSCFLFCYY